MKIKSGFVIHSVGDEHIVVPVGERTRNFHGIVRLNNSGQYLWEIMKDEFTVQTLVSALLEKYDVTAETAEKTATAFIKELEDGGLLEK